MSAPAEFDYKNFLQHVTRQPGVYQMFDQVGRILYVGKAKNLKNRVSSYFHKSGLNPKTQALVQRIHTIEVTVAASEAEALLLEQNLIKSQRPPYNILLRDDKSYPYVFLSQGDYPRLALHRGPKKFKGRYFGPFPGAGAVRDSLQFLQKTFRVRQCEDSVFRNRSRPCLQYQIGRCTGPCVGLVTPQDYSDDVRHTVMFLEGKSETLHDELVRQMEVAAEVLEFEKAAACRDQITALRQVQGQHAAESGTGNVDVVACAAEAGEVCVHVLFIRQGRVLGSKSYFPKDLLGEGESALLGEFLAQFYLTERAMDVPGEVVISHEVEGVDALEEAVRQSQGKNLAISHRVRTHRARWLAMALEAARQNLRMRLGNQATLLKKYEALQAVLQLDDMPERMECFDISHSSGERPVASCVVFNQSGPVKSEYRRFNIEGIDPGDDYAAMEQALLRRYSRLQQENKSLPSLLLVDGGKGQLSKARQVMEELGIQSITLLGVAKGTTRKPGFETLVLENGIERVLEGDDPALHLIQQIRDEAHRFAVTGHKQARDKRRRKSRLEDIPGVGPTRRRQLLQRFGGLQEVMRASVDDLARVPGISKKLAQEVYTALHSE
jgi:excinuclease ABC subunit C